MCLCDECVGECVDSCVRVRLGAFVSVGASECVRVLAGVGAYVCVSVFVWRV